MFDLKKSCHTTIKSYILTKKKSLNIPHFEKISRRFSNRAHRRNAHWKHHRKHNTDNKHERLVRTVRNYRTTALKNRNQKPSEQSHITDRTVLGVCCPRGRRARSDEEWALVLAWGRRKRTGPYLRRDGAQRSPAAPSWGSAPTLGGQDPVKVVGDGWVHHALRWRRDFGVSLELLFGLFIYDFSMRLSFAMRINVWILNLNDDRWLGLSMFR